MDYGVEIYLNQTEDIKILSWSEPLTETSVVRGANTVVDMDYGQFGAIYIVITLIIVSAGPLAVPGVPTPVTFTDQFQRVLFVMDADVSGNGEYAICRVIKANKLFVQANRNTNYNFTVQHHYLINTKK